MLPMVLGLAVIAPEAFALGGGGSTSTTSQPEPKIAKIDELPQGETKDTESKPVNDNPPAPTPDKEPVIPGTGGDPDIDGDHWKNGNLPQGKTREDYLPTNPPPSPNLPTHETFGGWDKSITTKDGVTTRFGYDLFKDGDWSYEENHFDLSKGRAELIEGTYTGDVIGNLREEGRIAEGDVTIDLKKPGNEFLLDFMFSVEGTDFGFEDVPLVEPYSIHETRRGDGEIRGEIMGNDNDGIVGEFRKNGIMRGAFGATRVP